MRTGIPKTLIILVIVYAIASLIHFIHNAEFINDYPNLPDSWTRAGVYLAWLVLTTIGLSGCLLVSRGFIWIGFSILIVYAILGMDSLGHYILAPLAAHTLAMNLTILFEVVSASLVLIEVIRLTVMRLQQNDK